MLVLASALTASASAKPNYESITDEHVYQTLQKANNATIDVEGIKFVLEKVQNNQTLLASFAIMAARLSAPAAPATNAAGAALDAGAEDEAWDTAMPGLIDAFMGLSEAADASLTQQAEKDGPDSEAAHLLAANKLMSKSHLLPFASVLHPPLRSSILCTSCAQQARCRACSKLDERFDTTTSLLVR